jgi:rod shape-determining protein MreC
LIGILVLLLFCYLGLFTWNARTGYLDTIAERSGLEIVGYVLSPVVWLRDRFAIWWDGYLALVDVAAENARLRAELEQSRAAALLASEDKAELQRLRDLLGLEALHERSAFAARILAKRFGPQAVLKTFTVNKGFLNGATAGTPVVTKNGVVGRVLRAAPRTATVLMLTDPGFRLAVISNESRTPGILTGSTERRLEVAYVAQNARIAPGETLITSGADGSFPKGIPVGVVTQVTPGNEILFLQVHARPLVDMDRLEEVLLLEEKDGAPPLLPPPATEQAETATRPVGPERAGVAASADAPRKAEAASPVAPESRSTASSNAAPERTEVAPRNGVRPARERPAAGPPAPSEP